MQRKTLVAALAGIAVGAGVVLGLAAVEERRPHGVPRARRGSPGRRPAVGNVAIAAGYLGIERARVRAELHAGRTLGEIAQAVPGHSAGGLIAAIVAARENALADRLRAGTITSAQARRQLEHLRERVTLLVQRLRLTPGG